MLLCFENRSFQLRNEQWIDGFFLNVQADGWIVEKISLLANPNQVRPTRFWGVYTKLKIFNMTNYKKGI